MATIALTEQTFDEVLNGNDIVLVDFWAAWCGPCRAFAPVYDKVAADNDDIVFGKVDTEAEPALAESFRIRSIPTLAIFREGIGVYVQPGAIPERALRDLVAQVRALDMDEVRRKVAASTVGRAAG